jgi:hypothetical protein
VLLATSGAVALAGVIVAQAGQFITATDAVTVAGFRSGFDGNQGHGVSPARDYMRNAPEKSERAFRRLEGQSQLAAIKSL